MSLAISPFFSNFSSFEDEDSENAVQLAFALLPSKFDVLCETDKLCVMRVCIGTIESRLSPIFSRDYEIQTDRYLQSIVELARRLSEHLDQVSETTFVSGRSLRQEWIAQLFRVDPHKSLDGTALQNPLEAANLGASVITPGGAVRTLAHVSELALRARKRLAPKHRPDEDLLLSIVYPLVRAWAALECMTGQPMGRCLPNKRNRGRAWCWSMVSELSAGRIIGATRLTERSERTVVKRVSEANKELRRRLLSTPFAEAPESWNELTWLSHCGLDLLYRAAMPPSRDCLLRDHPLIDEFDLKHSEWINALADVEDPDWVDDV